MRILILFFVFAFLSCNKKQEPFNSDLSNNKSLNQDIHDSEKKKGIKNFLINEVYNEDDFDFSDVRINYSSGKFVIDNDFNEFIIDSTLDREERYQTLKDYAFSEYADDRSIIRISNYAFSLQKNNSVLYVGLFRKTKEDNWKCKDIKKLEKYSVLGDYNYILGDNKVFSYTCETMEGHSCFAIVIDKVNSVGKYDKILKAIKFDLINEKIIEVDLKKEKVECLPEIGD
ncbi:MULTISPECIES: hypothetical protein [unclassified Flavobacterium]|uniref:hypothetical protein n=1 Tax=unclassified Flavobacterium TaxID=196869 RepID=UPI000F0CC468|nr:MULTISPECIES: hypothetical protein [unclassified Flavobacterium]AYN05781.1 hypothetical protein EAG11_17705 [Flavobacterium sp. 140616W15]MCD0474194.1 hypothetical protein [Flavobacterium sp. EDS]